MIKKVISFFNKIFGNFCDKLKKLGTKNEKIKSEKIKSKKIKNEIFSDLKLALALIIFIGVNIGAKILTEKFSLKVDLTQNKAFSLTEESKNYVSNLEKEVEIIILNDKDKFTDLDDYFKQSDSVINEYAKYSNKITVKYINLEQNPNIKSEYAEEDIRENSIIVKSGENHKILSAQDLFNVEKSAMGASILSSKAEQAMTSAIISVVSENKIKLDILTGFDEVGSEGIVKMLESNNYDVKMPSMLTENLDKESSAAFIFAPNRDYDSETINKVKSYLENNGEYGKNLIYFVNSGQKIQNNLLEFIKEWGISIKEGWVFEPDISKRLVADQWLYTICEYSYNSQYPDLVKNKSIPVAMPFSRPLEILDESKAETLLSFSKSAGIYPENAAENWVPSENDINKGPIPCLAIAEKKNDETGKKSTLTVVGAVTAADEFFLSKPSLNNSSYFLNLINTLTEKEGGVNIEPKTVGVRDMLIDAQMAFIIGMAFIFALPILVLFIGLVLWILKRKR